MQKSLVPLGVLLAGGIIAGLWYALPHSEAPPAADDPKETAAVVPDYQPPSTASYVGSAACVECHAEIAESYKSHPMSRSIEPVTSQTLAHIPEGGTARVGEGNKWYEVEFADGEMRHSAKLLDSKGEAIYEQVVPMHFVVGSGHEAKAYLHQRGGLLFMSPLNWYAKADKWDFAPGYDVDDPRRFDRRATDQCVGCHAGRVAPVGRSLNRFQKPAFHEMAIGCENCHGPGAEHIAIHHGDMLPETSDPIVNPGHLTADLRDSVCYQCHLHGEARILRYGRSDFDFRPGMHFNDVWTLLVKEGNPDDKSGPEAVSQVQQMLASRCYQESQGRLGCISCHDPHGSPSEPDREAFYRNRCLTCHQEAGCSLPTKERALENDSCISCHMPAKTTSDIAHVAQTDHRVPKSVMPTSAVAPTTNSSEDSLAFFGEAQRHMEPWEKDRALGLGASMYLAKTNRPLPTQFIRKLDAVLETVPEDGAILSALGAKALDHGRLDLAERYFEKALGLPDVEESARWGLLKAHYLSRRWNEALVHADWLVELDEGDYRAQAIRADILVQLGQLRPGIKAAEASLRYNPTLVEVRVLLHSLYQRSLEHEKAQEQERIIEKMKEAAR